MGASAGGDAVRRNWPEFPAGIRTCIHALPQAMAIPAREWLSGYKWHWLRSDLAAGVTLAAYLLPAGIGDASLAGLPPEAGLYACLFGGLAFWLFCSSRHTVVTVTSAISLLVGATLAEIAPGDPARHLALASLTALVVAVIAFAAYAVRAGAIVNFLSETVLVGFKCGVAFFLASTQLPKLFGFSGAHGGDFWHRMAVFLGGLGGTNVTALALGVTALALLLLGKTVLKNRPVALIVVVLGIVASGTFRLSERGVSLLGEVPQGLPMPQLPAVTRDDINIVLPLAMACFILAAVETTAIGRMFGEKHGNRLDATQEFLAIGAANLVAGFGRAFPISGGMSQSLVNESAGARTPLSGLVAAILMLLVALFFTELLRNLPQPVLAAVILVAVTGLVRVDALRRIWQFSRAEFGVAMVAMIGVLGGGLLNGVLFGVALSLLLLIGRSSRPRVVELGRVPGTSHFAELARHEQNERIPGVLVVRSEGALLYYNVNHVRDRLAALMAECATPPRLVVLFMGNVPHVDLAGTEMLLDLDADLRESGVAFSLAEVHSPVRDALRRVRPGVPLAEAHLTVDTVLQRWRSTTGCSP